MNEDTVKLLKECTSGCKMALESMKQVKGVTEDEKLLDILAGYKEKHDKLKEKAGDLLAEAGEKEKEPGAMATACSWFTTEMKLMMEHDSHQIAKLMMDGCNMGIQSISEHQNQFKEASKEAKDIAQSLVKIEEDFMEEMKQFL